VRRWDSRGRVRRWYGEAGRGYDERFGRWEAWCVGVFWVLMLLMWFRLLPFALPLWIVLLPLLWRPIGDAFRGSARRPGRIVATGLVTFVVLVALANVLVQGILQPMIGAALGVPLTNLNTAGGMEQLRAQPWLYLLFVVVGPFEEEVSYRYGLFRLLERVNVPVAHVATGLVFALQHVVVGWLDGHPDQLLLIPGFVTFSVILTLLYRRTGNFLPGFLAHALANGVPLAFVLLSS